MTQLTLYDICGEDMEICAEKLADQRIEITVYDDDEKVLFHEITHRYAWESLVYFAKQIVCQSARIQHMEDWEDD